MNVSKMFTLGRNPVDGKKNYVENCVTGEIIERGKFGRRSFYYIF